jgi:hypothetical protein
MPFVDRREQLLAETGRRVKGGTSKVKGSAIGEEAFNRIISLGRLVRYAFIVVLFPWPWHRI